MILTNARLIFPDGIRDGLEVVVHDGKIDAIRPPARARGKDVVDLAGNYLAPGFVDLHVHGALGRDTMEGSAEAFRAICDFHASGGTTSLLLTTATAPIEKLVEVLRVVRDWIVGAEVGTPRRGVRTARRAVPTIAGVHVEGPFISKEKCGAQPAEFIQDPSADAVQRLLEHADVIKRVTIAPELPGALETIENFRKHGISVSGGHSDAWDEDARHHVSPTLMKMLYRAKGPGGICLVTDATAGAGLPDESRFSLFGNDCVVEGGVCLLSDRSALAGSASRMIDLVRNMVHDVAVPLHEAVAMATQNPAQTIGLQTKGRLRVGADADLVILSPDLEIPRVFTGGDELASNRQ